MRGVLLVGIFLVMMMGFVNSALVYDSDDGLNYYEVGQCVYTLGGPTNMDYCVRANGDTQLLEYYVEDLMCLGEFHDCADDGEVCDAGICVTSTCNADEILHNGNCIKAFKKCEKDVGGNPLSETLWYVDINDQRIRYIDFCGSGGGTCEVDTCVDAQSATNEFITMASCENGFAGGIDAPGTYQLVIVDKGYNVDEERIVKIKEIYTPTSFHIALEDMALHPEQNPTKLPVDFTNFIDNDDEWFWVGIW